MTTFPNGSRSSWSFSSEGLHVMALLRVLPCTFHCEEVHQARSCPGRFGVGLPQHQVRQVSICTKHSAHPPPSANSYLTKNTQAGNTHDAANNSLKLTYQSLVVTIQSCLFVESNLDGNIIPVNQGSLIETTVPSCPAEIGNPPGHSRRSIYRPFSKRETSVVGLDQRKPRP